MTPTEYQRGKYRSLAKELPELEKRVAKQDWRWAVKTTLLVIIVSTVAELIIEKMATGSVSNAFITNNWVSIITRSLFWFVVLYFLAVRGLSLSLKKKKQELEGLRQKFPELHESEKQEQHDAV